MQLNLEQERPSTLTGARSLCFCSPISLHWTITRVATPAVTQKTSSGGTGHWSATLTRHCGAGDCKPSFKISRFKISALHPCPWPHRTKACVHVRDAYVHGVVLEQGPDSRVCSILCCFVKVPAAEEALERTGHASRWSLGHTSTLRPPLLRKGSYECSY